MSFHRSEVDVLVELSRNLEKSGQIAMLGSQTLWLSFGELVELLIRKKIDIANNAILDASKTYAGYVRGHTFFSMLGYDAPVSFDLIKEDEFTVEHDLSFPIQDYDNNFSLVLDGNTGLHVYDRIAFLKNAVRILKPGGRVIHTFTIGKMGRSFYSLSIQLLKRFYSECGFKNMKAFICSHSHSNSIYELKGDLNYQFSFSDLNKCSLIFSADKTEQSMLPDNVIEWEYVVSTQCSRVLDSSLLKDKKFYIWGASGNYMDNFSELVKSGEIKPLGLIDQDKSLHGREMDGCRIFSPEHLREADFDFILIASTYLENIFYSLCELVPHKPDVLKDTYAMHRWAFEIRYLQKRALEFRYSELDLNQKMLKTQVVV